MNLFQNLPGFQQYQDQMQDSHQEEIAEDYDPTAFLQVYLYSLVYWALNHDAADTATADSTAAKKIWIFKSFLESPVNHLQKKL